MDIVEELRRDRESGAKRLVNEYKAGMMSLAMRFCADESSAEELVNATFAKVVANIDGYLEQSAFFAWMCQILTNLYRDSVKRKARKNEILSGDVPDMPDDGARDEIFRNVDHSLLRDAIETLPKEMKEAIMLHYIADQPIGVAARFLRLPVSTVKWRLHAARRELSRRLGAKVSETARKPGGKALLLALALACTAALGAAVWSLASGWGEPSRRADATWTSGTGATGETGETGATGGTGATGEGTGATGAAGATDTSLASPARLAGHFVPFVPSVPDLSTPSAQENQTMNAMTLRTLAASAALAVSTGTADTLTWIGGSSGLLSVSSNWTPSASPQPGDTCVFHSAVTLEAEDFDFGAGGLTLENDATLTVLTHFAGTGGITKRGNGTLAIKNTTAGTFTGDVTIEAGQLNLASGSAIQFGQGKIIFTQISASNYFITQGDFYSQNLKNEIEFRGESSTQAIYLCRNATISGSISSLYDFRIGIDYLGFTVSGGINAPGRTVTIEFPQSWNSCECNLSGSINASLVKKHSKDTTLSGRSDYIDNTLRVEGGNLILASAGYWGGTNVQVVGSTSVLRLRGSQNLSTTAAVQLEDGGKLNLDSTCAVTVSKLIVDGAAQRSGVYSASNLPDSITGSGTIIVSPKTWIGGASGYLSAAGNWSDGLAPQPGDVLAFSNPVELLNETVNLGAEGFTLSSSHAISNHVWFTGAGGIVKRGSGIFYQLGDAGGDFAGGARFEGDCILSLNNRYMPGTNMAGHKFFGTGAITIYGGYTRISTGEWACGLTNTIVLSNVVIPYWNDPGWGSLMVDQGNVVFGPIVADADFLFHVRNVELHIPSIDAPGHTVRFDTYWGSGNSYASGPIVDGPVNANVATAGNRTITFNGSSPNPDHSLTLTTCTNVLSSTAYWGGSNIVVSGTNTRLVLTNAGNLSEEAQISVLNGGKIDIASGVKVKVGALTVDGVAMADGIYGAANLPSAITGGGKLRIGEGATVLYIR